MTDVLAAEVARNGGMGIDVPCAAASDGIEALYRSRGFTDRLVVLDPAEQVRQNQLQRSLDAPRATLKIVDAQELTVNGQPQKTLSPLEALMLNMLINTRGKGFLMREFTDSPFLGIVGLEPEDRKRLFVATRQQLEESLLPDLIDTAGRGGSVRHRLGAGILIDTSNYKVEAARALRQSVIDFVRGDSPIPPFFAGSAEAAQVRIGLTSLFDATASACVGLDVDTDEAAKEEKAAMSTSTNFTVDEQRRFELVQKLLNPIINSGEGQPFVLHEGHLRFIQQLTRARHLRVNFDKAACRDANPEIFHPVSASGRNGAKQLDDRIEFLQKEYCARCPIRQDCLNFGQATTDASDYYTGGRRLYGGMILGDRDRLSQLSD